MRAIQLGWCLLLFGSLASGQKDQPASSPSDAPDPDTSNSSAGSKSSSLPDLTPDANGALSQEQMRELTRVVAQNYRDNYKKERDYTYIEREVTNKLDGKGQIKSTETKTYEVMKLYGEPVARLIQKDDKPLNEKDAAKEEGRIQKLAEKRKNESEEEQKKRSEERRVGKEC